jgi:hypothetical protein
MAEEQKPEKKKDEDWMQKKWRPAMGWMYMGICTLDMAVFPVLWSVLQMIQHTTITQWQPLTLQGAGLFHIAMGAVLGISAFGRTQEKLAGTAANPTATTQTTNTNVTGMNTGGMNTGGFGASNGFGSTPLGNNSMSTAGGFGSPAPSFAATPPAAITTGFNGKKAPPEPAFPEI